MKYIAKTFHGLEPVLAEELRQLGAEEIEPLKRAVSFQGNRTLMYQTNLHLRTALRILVPIHSFEAQTEDALYQEVYDFDWSPYLDPDRTFAIDTTVYSERFTHSKYVALKAKDAIVDQLRKKHGKRPSVDTRNPDLRIHIHLIHSAFTLLLDSSGDSLHKRGYRTRNHPAPINEVLAAGMIQLAGWQPEQTLYDPMCGSGTILLEAALLATDTAPGLIRRTFGFQSWKDHDATAWEQILEGARGKAREPDFSIFGSDNDQEALDIFQESLYKLGWQRKIRVKKADFRRIDPPTEEGLIITNPPYGERIGPVDTPDFYRQIGDTLKQHWAGWDAWLISSNFKALKSIGLRPSQKMTLYNGPLECKFQKFSMYKGTKKNKEKPGA